MEKLSIIIPAFNAEKYIQRCLNSVLDQEYNINVEIIVVNDGSTDSTAQILNDYKIRYPNIFRIVSKPNEGASSARNIGLDMADGDWVWFIDSDDYIPRNSISYEIDRFLSDDVDICKFGSITLDPITLKSFKEPERVIGTILYEGKSVLGYDKIRPTFACTHIYRRSAIQGIKFKNITIAEDAIFNLEVYMRDLRVRDTSTNIYRYTVNEGQLTGKRDVATMRNSIIGYEKLFDMAKQYQKESDNNVLKKAMDNLIANQFTPFLSRVLCAHLTKHEYSELMNRLVQKGIFPVRELGNREKIVNFIGKYHFLYTIESYLYRKVFIPCVLPRLSRNKNYGASLSKE